MLKKLIFGLILSIAVVVLGVLAAGPELSAAIPNMTWNEDNNQTFNVSTYFTAADNGSNGFTATAVSNIAIAIDNTTGLVTLTPDANFFGNRTVTFTAYDTNSTNSSNLVSLTVNSVNDIPVITSTPSTTGTVGTQYSYQVTVTDIDNVFFVYAVASNATGVTTSNDLITWTPTATGLYDFALVVSDGSDTAAQNWTINVSEDSKLKITKLEVKVDGERDKNVDDEETIGEKATPEAKVEFKVDVENMYTKSEDIDIDNIELTVTIEDIDDGDDLEESPTDFDIKAGKDETVTVKFDLPMLIDEDTYTVTIFVEGEDDNGDMHEDEWTVYLRVDKDSHDVRITQADLSSSRVTCNRNINLNLEVTNLGSKDEDEVRVTAVNQELDLNFDERDIELDEGSDPDDSQFERSLHLTVPDNFALGTYMIEVNTYYDTSKHSDSETVALEIAACVATTTTTPTTTAGTGTTLPSGATLPIDIRYAEPVTLPKTAAVADKGMSTLFDGSLQTSLIISGIVVLLGLLIYGFGYVVLKK